MKVYIIILFYLLSINLSAWDKINYLGGDNIGGGGAVAAEVGDIDNIIVNPAAMIFRGEKKIDIKISGMKLFSGFETSLYNYSIGAGYDIENLTIGMFYGSFLSDMYVESIFSIGSSKEVIKDFIVGVSFIFERTAFELPEGSSDMLFNSASSLSYNDWYFSPGILYIPNENLSIGLYSSELFGNNFDFSKSIIGIGIRNLVYENSKAFLNEMILKLDVYTIGGEYQNFKAGLEFYLFRKYLQIMVGYNRNNISFGVGFSYRKYTLNLAYLLYNTIEDFGNTAKVSIDIKF